MDIRIISGILGILGGVLASLFTPWMKWQFEKKRERYANRKKFITEIRDIAIRCQSSNAWGWFISISPYAQLRPHLSNKLRNQLESNDYTNAAPQILDAIHKLEKDWHIL